MPLILFWEDEVRRTIFLTALMAVGGLALMASSYRGHQQQSPPIAAIERIKDNLYIIKGSDPRDPSTGGSGNTAVFITEQGVVVVDTKSRGYGQGILNQIKTVTPRPVTMIINTHTHSDHSGGNVEFPGTVEVIAHENTKANMAKVTCAPVVNCQSFKGENAKFLPRRTFKDTMSLMSGKDRIDLYYFGRGHTSGDTWVVFPAVRVVHAGDMFQRKTMPFIDGANSGGSAVEFAKTLARAAAEIPNVDTVIPGHFNGLFSWNDFQEYVEFYNEFFVMVRDGKKSRKSADEIARSYRPSARFRDYDFDPQWAKAARLGPEIDSEFMKANVRAIYNELEK
jgi:glyoxylase-like metal-dependent hydrolase (beta-lactamase superfamily II)